MTLIDTHAHLDHTDHAETQLREAAEAGVEAVVAVGVDLAANQIHLKLAKECKAPAIFLAFGIHPGNIITPQIEPTLQFIREHKSEAVAIGEIGLDYWYPLVKKSDERKKQQRDVFQMQLDLAKEFDLPVSIHSRGAWKDCFDMAQATGIKRAVFHWYSGPVDILKNILDAGYFISATPALFYSPQLQEAVKVAPIEQTMIETDTPVVYPVRESDRFQSVASPCGENKTGFSNGVNRLSEEKSFKAGPKDVFFTLDVYAKLKNLDKEKAASVLNANAKKFFNLPL